MKSSQPGSRPGDRRSGAPPPYCNSQFVPMPSPLTIYIHGERCHTGGEPTARIAANIAPRRSLLIIDGSNAVSQTGLPEVRATESSGDLRCCYGCSGQPPSLPVSPGSSDSSPVERSRPLWLPNCERRERG